MTTLVIIRHGFSHGNKDKKFSGQMDVALDEVGYRQAQDIAKHVLGNFKIDAVYSSDLCRAYDTVKPIADGANLPVCTLKALREVDVGLWQGMLIEDVAKIYPESFALYKRKPGLAQFDGGESYGRMLARVQPAIERIARENDGKTVVIGTHGGVIRVLRSAWTGVSLDRIEEIPHVPNASVTVAEYDGGKIALRQVGYCDYLTDKTTEEGVK